MSGTWHQQDAARRSSSRTVHWPIGPPVIDCITQLLASPAAWYRTRHGGSNFVLQLTRHTSPSRSCNAEPMLHSLLTPCQTATSLLVPSSRAAAQGQSVIVHPASMWSWCCKSRTRKHASIPDSVCPVWLAGLCAAFFSSPKWLSALCDDVRPPLTVPTNVVAITACMLRLTKLTGRMRAAATPKSASTTSPCSDTRMLSACRQGGSRRPARSNSSCALQIKVCGQHPWGQPLPVC